jgi:hypothetical protein
VTTEAISPICVRLNLHRKSKEANTGEDPLKQPESCPLELHRSSSNWPVQAHERAKINIQGLAASLSHSFKKRIPPLGGVVIYNEADFYSNKPMRRDCGGDKPFFWTSSATTLGRSCFDSVLRPQVAVLALRSSPHTLVASHLPSHISLASSHPELPLTTHTS